MLGLPGPGVGGHSPRCLDSQAGALSTTPPGAVQGEGCCERGLGLDSVGSCSGLEGGGDMAQV